MYLTAPFTVIHYFCNCCISGIQKLVLAGRIGEAIEMTQALYPGLLERNQNLLFLLKCRQFVEMVSGNDSEVRPSAHSPRSSPNVSPTHSYGATSVSSVGASSSGSTSNGLVSNGVDHGLGDDDDAPMEVEDVEESSNGSAINGDAMIEDPPHSPRKSKLSCYSAIREVNLK